MEKILMDRSEKLVIGHYEYFRTKPPPPDAVVKISPQYSKVVIKNLKENAEVCLRLFH
jgi:hypothetical protein